MEHGSVLEFRNPNPKFHDHLTGIIRSGCQQIITEKKFGDMLIMDSSEPSRRFDPSAQANIAGLDLICLYRGFQEEVQDQIA